MAIALLLCASFLATARGANYWPNCPCTGNQGFWKGTDQGGKPYDHGQDYGNTCKAWDDTDPSSPGPQQDACPTPCTFHYRHTADPVAPCVAQV